MNTEELLRRAFEEQALLAPDPDRVLEGFRTRARRNRRLRMLAVGTVAAAATAAILIGQAALSGPAEKVESFPGQVQSRPPLAPVPLQFRPTWLPPGYAEVSRSSRYDDPQVGGSRLWAPIPEPTHQPQSSVRTAAINLWIAKDDTKVGGEPGAEKVMVNGHEGARTHDDVSCSISWKPSSDRTLTVIAIKTPKACGDALQVARSMVPDTGTKSVSPLRPSWLPAGYQVDAIDTARTTSGCRNRVVMSSADGDVTIEAFANERLPDVGERMRIAGREARYFTVAPPDREWPPGSTLLVDAGAGRLLAVLSDPAAVPLMDKRILARIAAAVEVGDVARSCTW